MRPVFDAAVVRPAEETNPATGYILRADPPTHREHLLEL